MSAHLLEQHAVVTRVEDDTVWVEAREPSGCGTCGGGGCSTRRLAELFRVRKQGFKVRDPLGVKAGEHVWVGYPAGTVLRGALLAYGLPLFLLIAGSLLGRQLLSGDEAAVAGGLAGLGLGMFLLWLNGGQRSLPVIVRRDGPDPQGAFPVSFHS